MKTYVLYHCPCSDGFGAAWAAYKKLGHGTTDDPVFYVGVNYGNPMPVMDTGSNVFILDFSYKRPELIALTQRMRYVLVLDHHSTAEAELAGLECARFSPNQSGAVMAWEFFHGGEVPLLLRYVQDRDLWKWAMDGSKEFNAAVRSYPMTFEAWDRLQLMDAYLLMEEGQAILRHISQQVDLLMRHVEIVQIKGYTVPVIHSPVYQSELGDAMMRLYAGQFPFAAIVSHKTDGGTIWSLRSRDDFDVAEVAKSFGGGGGKNAAGFSLAPGMLTPPT